MKIKLSPDICYMAGLTRNRMDRNAVGIITGIKEIAERFAGIANKEFGIEPKKIIESESKGIRKIYFYHSRVSKRLGEIRSKEDRLFRAPNEAALSYLAGIIDSSARFSSNGIYIEALTPQDEVFLANLGIHTRNGRVSNISMLVKLAKPYSTVLKSLV
ncbi:MAG: hypothetical protein QXF01_02745 [Candidatus Micrarchaeaceae archaeon]